MTRYQQDRMLRKALIAHKSSSGSPLFVVAACCAAILFLVLEVLL